MSDERHPPRHGGTNPATAPFIPQLLPPTVPIVVKHALSKRPAWPAGLNKLTETENKAQATATGHELDMTKIMATHSPRDLLLVGFAYAAGGGGVNAIIGARFLMGETRQETAAAVMFFVVAGLMAFAGVWCWVKRARLLRAARS